MGTASTHHLLRDAMSRQLSAWCRAGWCTCASRPTLWPGCGSRSSSSMASHEEEEEEERSLSSVLSF